MRYILTNRYSLCGYKGAPFALYDEDYGEIHALSLADFMVLEACDGRTEIQDGETLQKLKRQGVIRQPLMGEVLEKRRRYRDFGVPFFPQASLSPTERCNLNCRHCFMAKDVNPQAAQLSFEECVDLLDQLADCGVREIRLTGGEPTIHPQFREIMWAAQERGLRVRQILTNGFMLTDEALDDMRDHNVNPLLMISFDGVGCHDWLRNLKGAEQKTLEVMEHAVKKGFPVVGNMCVHQGNVHALRATAEEFDKIGVEVMRVIRVAEAPRWMETSEDSHMYPREYFEAILEFFDWYVDSDLKPMLELWGLLRWYPQENAVEWLTGQCDDEARRSKHPICASSRAMLQIVADGSIYPCIQCVGTMRAHGYKPRTIKTETIRDIISDEEWMAQTYPTMADFYAANPECKNCEHRLDCQGGCRAVGYGTSNGNLCGIDVMRCTLLKEGYFARAKEIVTRKLS